MKAGESFNRIRECYQYQPVKNSIALACHRAQLQPQNVHDFTRRKSCVQLCFDVSRCCMSCTDQRRLNDVGLALNPFSQPFEMNAERRAYFRTFQYFWNAGPNRFFTGKENRPWEESPLANRFILHPDQTVGDVFQQDPSFLEHPFFLDPVVIEWTVDGVPISNQNGSDHWLSPNGTLMLFNLQDYPGSQLRPKEYRCLATNSLGTIISRPAFIGMACKCLTE